MEDTYMKNKNVNAFKEAYTFKIWSPVRYDSNHFNFYRIFKGTQVRFPQNYPQNPNKMLVTQMT